MTGFEPEDDTEGSLLAAVHKRLSFDPRLEAHRLHGRDDDDPRSAKCVLEELTSGDRERELRCLQAPIASLMQRGERTGLAAFLTEVVQRLIPRLTNG